MSSYNMLEIEKWQISRDGPVTLEAVKSKLRKLGYSCTDYTFPPGMHFPDHTHGVSKKDAIVTGKFRLGIFGREVILEPGDIIDIPKETVHNATVIGNEPVVFIDATKAAPNS